VALSSVFSLLDDQIDGQGAGVLDVGSGGVEVIVVGDDLVGTTHQFEQNPLRRTALMCRQDVPESGEVGHDTLKSEETLRTGIGFVALHDAGPLEAAHGPGAAISQEIDQHVMGVEIEHVEMRRRQEAGALLPGGHGDRFDDLDPERFDDGLHERSCLSSGGEGWGRACGTPRRAMWYKLGPDDVKRR
jgi:hypothetical protein